MVDPAPSAAGRITRLLVVLSASLALLSGFVGTALAVRWVQLRDVGTGGSFARAVPSGSTAPPPGKCSDHPCNYLLLGSDSRAGLPIDEQHQFGTNKDGDFHGGTCTAGCDGGGGGQGGVPEPATWAMMIMGFGGVGALMRRRRTVFG